MEKHSLAEKPLTFLGELIENQESESESFDY